MRCIIATASCVPQRQEQFALPLMGRLRCLLSEGAIFKSNPGGRGRVCSPSWKFVPQPTAPLVGGKHQCRDVGMAWQWGLGTTWEKQIAGGRQEGSQSSWRLWNLTSYLEDGESLNVWNGCSLGSMEESEVGHRITTQLDLVKEGQVR